MGALRRRVGQIARIPARMWNHGLLWGARRKDVSNWGELWSLSNPIRLVAEKRLHASGSTRDVVVRFRSGLKLAVDSSMREALAGLVDTYPTYMRNLGISLVPGDVVIDVGAHVGAFSVPALFDNPGIKILAFEPDPQNFRLLKENAARNGLDGNRLLTYNLAVANTEEELMFARGQTSTTGSVARTGFFKASPDSEMVVVSTTTIENIFRQHAIDACRLLKVDCEGSEYEILGRLADATFARIENIIVEAHPARVGNPADLKALLEAKGFEVIEHRHSNGCSDLYCHRPV